MWGRKTSWKKLFFTSLLIKLMSKNYLKVTEMSPPHFYLELSSVLCFLVYIVRLIFDFELDEHFLYVGRWLATAKMKNFTVVKITALLSKKPIIKR